MISSLIDYTLIACAAPVREAAFIVLAGAVPLAFVLQWLVSP